MNEWLSRANPRDVILIGLALLAGGVLVGMYSERARLYAKFRKAAAANKEAPKETVPVQT
jgi:hypothetical protein